MTAPTCVVADDHPPVLAFLERYLVESGIEVTGSGRDGAEALRRIEQTRPRVAVLDARMPGLSGVEVARRLRAAGAATGVVLYTGYGNRALVREALDAGVRSVVDKKAPLDELVQAIRVVADGGTYAAAGTRTRTRELTPRERDVLRLLADGLSNELIARELGISARTVRTHVQRAIDRLGATTRTHAVATALRESLIS